MVDDCYEYDGKYIVKMMMKVIDGDDMAMMTMMKMNSGQSSDITEGRNERVWEILELQYH